MYMANIKATILKTNEWSKYLMIKRFNDKRNMIFKPVGLENRISSKYGLIVLMTIFSGWFTGLVCSVMRTLLFTEQHRARFVFVDTGWLTHMLLVDRVL